MKKIFSVIMGITMIVGQVVPSIASNKNSDVQLTDINNHWAKESIESLISKKVVNGYPDKTFRPEQHITREEVAKMVDIYFGDRITKSTSEVKLNDISGRWSTENIKRLIQAGIIKGYPDKTFLPTKNITRAETASIVYNALLNTGEYKNNSKGKKISDIKNHWAEESIKKISEMGAITGYPNGEFKPDDKIKRAEVASIIYKLKIEDKPSIEITKFNTDPDTILVGRNAEVIFTAEVKGDNVNNVDELEVKDKQDNIITVMKDDGKGADKIAGDGIYSGKKNITANEVGGKLYHASFKGVKSNHSGVLFVNEEVTDKEIRDALKFEQKVKDINSEFSDDSGNIPTEKVDSVLNAVLGFVENEYKKGNIFEYNYEKDNDMISVRHKSGMRFDYFPIVAGMRGGQGRGSVETYQPYKSTSQDNLPYARLTHEYANMIKDKVMYSYDKKIIGYNVTLDTVKEFGRNSVILWDGHGAYSYKHGSSLCLTIENGKEFNLYKSIQDDIKFGRVTMSIGTALANYRFIDRYVGDLENSLIYLSTCSSLADDRLANSLLNKGARTIVGHNKSVTDKYAGIMTKSIIAEMVEKDSNDNFKSLENALNSAKEEHGEFDRDGITEVQIRGDSNYRFNDREISGISRINGTVCDARFNIGDEASAIVDVNVSFIKDGQQIKSVRTNSRGEFHVDLAPGTYSLLLEKQGYMDFNAEVTVEEGETKQIQPLMAVLEEYSNVEGIAKGTIRDAISINPVVFADIKVRKEWDNKSGEVVANVQSDENGEYFIHGITCGNYTIEINHSEYIKEYKNICILPEDITTSINQDIVMNPNNSEYVSGEMRAILTWGETPRDLDLHMRGKTWNNTGDRFQVCYSYKNYYFDNELVANLDVDDTSSYGPETMTLYKKNGSLEDEIYSVYVHDFSNRSSETSDVMSNSGAKISVFVGTSQVREFYIPQNRVGTVWHVFDYDANNGLIIPINSITNGPMW